MGVPDVGAAAAAERRKHGVRVRPAVVLPHRGVGEELIQGGARTPRGVAIVPHVANVQPHHAPTACPKVHPAPRRAH